MSWIPKLHKCPSCSHEFQWDRYIDFIGVKQPFCPECYESFLRKNVPIAKEMGE